MKYPVYLVTVNQTGQEWLAIGHNGLHAQIEAIYTHLRDDGDEDPWNH